MNALYSRMEMGGKMMQGFINRSLEIVSMVELLPIGQLLLMYMAFKVVFCCTLLECSSSLLIEFAKNSRQAGTLHIKRRKFVILLRLSTTTALSCWFPLFISRIVDFEFDIKIALYTVTLLNAYWCLHWYCVCLHTKKLSVAQEKIFPSKQ